MDNSRARRNLIALKQGDHNHSYAQVLLGWRGQMACEFHNGGRHLQQGLAAVVPGHADHFYHGLSQDCELLVLDLATNDPYLTALEQSCDQSLADTLFQQLGFITLGAQQQPMLEFAAAQLQQNNSALIHTQLVSLFITQLCQNLSERVDLLPTPHRLDISRFNQLIDSQHAEPPTNKQLADMLNLSESHFYSLCQQQLGMAPQQYLTQRKLRHAQQLLLNSDIPLAALAHRFGFADSSSFSRAYKRCFGQTPGSARKQIH